MKLAIYDMDGTIVCSQHRYKAVDNKIDLQFWRENCTDEMIAKDSLLPHSEQFFKDMDCINTVVGIATARAMEMGDANYKFIKKHLGMPDFLVHRKGESDTRKGVDLKNQGIIKNLGDLSDFESIRIYEDNHDYLQGMTEFCEKQNMSVYPVFVKSNQGY